MAQSWLLSAPTEFLNPTAPNAPPASLDLYGWHNGLLAQVSSIDGRICVREEGRCTELRAADPIATTPPPWRECLQRNAQLAAASRSG